MSKSLMAMANPCPSFPKKISCGTLTSPKITSAVLLPRKSHLSSILPMLMPGELLSTMKKVVQQNLLLFGNLNHYLLRNFYKGFQGAGVRADISVITSTTTGRSAVSALSNAGAISAGCSTRIPIQPNPSATRLIFTGPKR